VDPLDHVRHYFAGNGIEPSSLLLAISGGTDSTALLLLMAALRDDRWEIAAAHVNHHLRGEDADADEQFVRALCADLNVPLEVCDGTLDPQRVRDVGVEAAAREVRYRLLADVRARRGTRYLATAHQMDDQAETVLMRLVGGGGIASLRGVHAVRDGWILRPLLDVRRSELQALLDARGITARHDVSNDDPRFLRNRVRRVLRELDATPALARFASEMQEQWPLVERQILEAETQHAVVLPAETRFTSFPENAWLRQALLHRHIMRLDPQSRDVSARDLQRLARELERVRRVSVTARLELIRRGDVWILRAPPQPAPDFEVEAVPGAPVWLPHANVTLRIEAHHGARDTAIRQLVQLPPGADARFTVRNRRDGDRFQPLGLERPKKLKELLIDRKIAAGLRNSLPLLVWNDEIVLVAGVEVSEKFKVTTAPGDVFRVWLEGPLAEDESDQSDVQRR
jgi:tRNA(Ile)-lysidine synthase